MKKGKRLLSLFTAAAIAMSSFASFIVTANADDTVVKATLVHTAAAQGGSNAAETSLDAEEHYINNWGTSGWVATGYTEFSFADTDVSADSATRITNATLTFQTKCARGTRPMDVGLLDKDATAAIDFTAAIDMIVKPATVLASYTDISTTYATKTIDVTDALKTRISDGETRFIFAYAGATAGGNIYGKGAAEANQPTLSVTLADASAVPTKYTIKYVDGEGADIKTAVTADGIVGLTYKAKDADKADIITDGGKKYIYESGDTEIIAAENENDNVITLVFRAAEEYDVKVVAKGDDNVDLGTVYEGKAYEGDTVSAPYSRYIIKDNVLYLKEAGTDKSYNYSYTATATEQVLTYAKQADKTPVAFIEAETLGTPYSSNNVNIRCSGAAGLDTDELTTVTTLQPGTYVISSGCFGNSGRTFTVKAGETTVLTIAQLGYWKEDVSEEFTLTETTNITVQRTEGTAGTAVDYFLITGTGSVATRYDVTKADTENGTFEVDKDKAAAGETVTITATPDDTYIVDTITVKDADDNDVPVSADNTFTMPASNVTVKVTFKVPPVMYTVTIEDTENGTVEVDKPSAGAGETVTVTATPNDNYKATIEVFTVEGNSSIEVTNGKFTMPEGNVKVVVTFEKIPTYEVSVAATENGTVEVDKTTAKAGETVTITTTPDDGYEVDTITVGIGENSGSVIVTDNTFTMPATHVTVTVTFKVKEAVDYTKLIDFTNRTLTADSKGNSTTFDVTDAATAGATALAAADAGNVLKLGSGSSGAAKYFGYKSQFAIEDGNTVVYGGDATLSFKLEPMQVRKDKEASILLSFADINGTAILPITVNTGMTAGLSVNGTAATGIAYGNYYVVTYTMDFTNKTAGVKITTADGATTCLEVTGVAITAENITQLYKEDSDWTYGYCAIDDIQLNATDIGVPVYYTVTINTTRFAKMTTSTNAVYYADANGKIEIPLQKPGTTFDYTLSKVGYTDVTGSVAALEADFTDTKEMTLADEDIIFIESEFGNANEAYVSAGGNRNDTISLGSIEIPDISEINVDFNFAGFGGQGGQQKTWYIDTDGGKLVGLQMTDDGLFAWTGWTGSTNFNQSSDAGAYTSGVKIGDLPSGDFTVKFVLDKTNKAITISYGDTTNSLSYTIDATTITGLGTGLYRYNGQLNTNEFKITKPDVNYLAINGVSGVAKISGKTIERTYLLSQTVIVEGEEFTWTVKDADGNDVTGVTIADGVLSIADTATAGEVVITATSATNAEKTATFKVTIGDFQTMSTFTIDGPKAFDVKQTTGNYTVVSAKDSFGDEVKDLVPAVVWTSSDETVVTIDAATGVATVVGAGNATITATITNGTAVSTATIPVTVGTYYIVEDVTGDSTSIDISGLVNDSTVSGYMITTTKDGEVVKQTTVAKSEIGSITIAEDAAERIVVTYNETGAIASIATTSVGKGEEVDLAGTEISKVFLWNSLNGMVPVSAKTISGLITVDTEGADKVEIAPIYTTAINAELTVPAAIYDVTITVNNGARTDVYVNDQMMFNNVNQGSDNYTVKRVLPETAEYTAKDVYINEGYATFKMYDDKSSGTTVTKVTFVKTPDNKTRAKRVYAIGDSLVAKYYGDAPEGQEGLVRTGWGDVLGNYMAEGIEVTNLGNSGAHAEGMLSDAFTNVMHSAKAGDVVIWESGYNDRTYSTVERMKAAITTAIDFCKANDIEIYLVTPNASSHDYKESVVWASSIIELGTETDTPVIDLSAGSYNFLNNKYSAVEDVHALLQAVYNNTGDTLHSTYNAANCWAAIVAQGLYKAGKTDLVNTEYTYTYNDGTNDITVGVNLMDTEPAASTDEGTTNAE